MASWYSPCRVPTTILYVAAYYCRHLHSDRESTWARPASSQEAGGGTVRRKQDRRASRHIKGDLQCPPRDSLLYPILFHSARPVDVAPLPKRGVGPCSCLAD